MVKLKWLPMALVPMSVFAVVAACSTSESVNGGVSPALDVTTELSERTFATAAPVGPDACTVTLQYWGGVLWSL